MSSHSRPGDPGYEGGGGGGRHGPGLGSCAEILSSTLPTSWNKNFLEVSLDKDVAGALIVSEIHCAESLAEL